MFSFTKKPVVQEVVLQDLTENQLTQVAGGYDCNMKNDHDADDKKKKKHHMHHNMHHRMHHKHHMMNDHDCDNM